MKNSLVKGKWNEGKPVFCTLVKIKDHWVAEMASLMGFDCIWMDLEHHCIGVETAEDMMRAVRVGSSDVMARPAKGELMRMGRLLEAGAQGIMYPRCETADEAKSVVRWAKFAPLGERGFDGGNADSPYGSMEMKSYIEKANEETFILAQIESPSAVPNARSIAEVEGIDGIFFGPGDFSVLSGVPGQFESDTVQSAVRKVCSETLAAGKHFGTLVFSVEQARRMLDLGASFIAMGCDVVMVKNGMESLRDKMISLGFSFGGSQKGSGRNEYSK